MEAEVASCFQGLGGQGHLKTIPFFLPHSPPTSIISSIIRGRHSNCAVHTAALINPPAGPHSKHLVLGSETCNWQRPHNTDLHWPTLEALSEPSASASHRRGSDNTRSVRTCKCACVWWGEHGAAPAMSPYAAGSTGGDTCTCTASKHTCGVAVNPWNSKDTCFSSSCWELMDVNWLTLERTFAEKLPQTSYRRLYQYSYVIHPDFLWNLP